MIQWKRQAQILRLPEALEVTERYQGHRVVNARSQTRRVVWWLGIFFGLPTQGMVPKCLTRMGMNPMG